MLSFASMFDEEIYIKAEKLKARDLRKSNWWSRQLDKGLCYYCNTTVMRTAATMDHIVPLSKGGKTSKSNVVVSCKPCNNKKKDRDVTDWAINGV